MIMVYYKCLDFCETILEASFMLESRTNKPSRFITAQATMSRRLAMDYVSKPGRKLCFNMVRL